jgi:hypothetical protein
MRKNHQPLEAATQLQNNVALKVKTSQVPANSCARQHELTLQENI